MGEKQNWETVEIGNGSDIIPGKFDGITYMKEHDDNFPTLHPIEV